ncbi:hypothetical protein J3Q64DRAFT_1682608 [Phycomyces blakesleeanus]|uniref:Uncharacterized protein n=2 Tax=Phycomyces blakesleeanus TaxID=4837 RepID=A0A167RC57_PHYB8|nr:hypothetical protein PHYBLDRAFT_178895 [Phycomyces blakesleeanus NRRL 1555(-)]OAD81324.1 hypothetical protein PHYBLDRAFT_178895 [Phycomyces blakesleeanus NRRL 1555(-)]|eukprot:XP_018299364.1 hypothetical protein PHYBLDRAFT_178895 [Phycomyces blakesleeanus NRRL 1555(-)]
MLPFPTIVCPATCELCGHWMPQHSDECPRNGVHPSQWTLTINIQELDSESDTED